MAEPEQEWSFRYVKEWELLGCCLASIMHHPSMSFHKIFPEHLFCLHSEPYMLMLECHAKDLSDIASRLHHIIIGDLNLASSFHSQSRSTQELFFDKRFRSVGAEPGPQTAELSQAAIQAQAIDV